MAENVTPLRPTAADGPRAHRAAPEAAREPLWRHMLGDRLREARHERGETLGQTADRAGVSPQYLSEIERGVKEPSSEVIAAVGRALELTLLDLTVAVARDLHTDRARRRSTSAVVLSLAA